MDSTEVSSHHTGALDDAIALMRRLRSAEGCPWDREQTFDSLKPHTLEETYEVFDAIERRAWPDLKDELGDLLLQVLFYAQIAEEAGLFSIQEVAANLNAKLIRRHPHIFGEAVANTSEEVNRSWEAIKQTERAAGQSATERFLDPVPRHVPAMTEARKLGAHAAKIGFDWTAIDDLFHKLAEESDELQAEVHRRPASAAAQGDELGDLLFTAVNLSRHLRIDPEFALRSANAKFRRRFSAMEGSAGGIEALRQMRPDELERRWQIAKASDAARPASPSAAESPSADESHPGNSSHEPE